MTNCREASLVKREAYSASEDRRCPHTTRYRCETSPVEPASFRESDASRFTNDAVLARQVVDGV